MGRLNILAISFNFMLMIGSHFNYSHLGIFLHLQQRERYSNMVIEISLGGVRFIMSR